MPDHKDKELVGDIGDVQRSLNKRKSKARQATKGTLEDVQTFKQGDKEVKYKQVKEPKLSGREKRVYDRVTKRKQKQDERRDRRASLVAIRKGMSKDQAKDFMANRRDRFNSATREFFKGVIGAEQNLDNIKDRAYRKSGSGTLQNVKAADGSTYDATAPFQGEGAGYTGRGQQREKPDNYEVFAPKAAIELPTQSVGEIKFNIEPPKNPVKIEKEEKKEETKETVKNLLEPTVPNNPAVNFQIGSAYTDTVNPTTPNYGEQNSFMTKETQADRDRRNVFQKLFGIGRQ